MEEEDPYASIGLNEVSSGIPIEGYIDYSYEIGRKGSNPGEFGGWIQYFTVSPDGKILYACDIKNRRIQAIDIKSRKPLLAFPTSVDSYKSQPRGVNVFRNGDLCVNCKGYDGSSRIGIFSAEGRLLNMFGREVISTANAMAVDNLDRISIMDKRRARIITITKEGKAINQFDPMIEGDVLRMTTDSRGRIIIPDHMNNRIVAYEHHGVPVIKIKPAKGSGSDFKYPAGVSCDADDNILVCDVGNNRVSQFNSEGAFRSVILSKKENHLLQPHDVVATRQGHLVINEVSRTFLKVFCFSGSF